MITTSVAGNFRVIVLVLTVTDIWSTTYFATYGSILVGP